MGAAIARSDGDRVVSLIRGRRKRQRLFRGCDDGGCGVVVEVVVVGVVGVVDSEGLRTGHATVQVS